jgi:cytoskeletal protein CcmA (bactofilin family)
MKTRLGLRLGVALAVGLASLIGGAGAGEFRSGDEIKLDGDFNDVVFVSGGQLAIGAKVMDDIFATGGELNYTGASADHVITAGGQITFTNVQVKDIVAAGGEIILSNTQVGDDVILAGGQITISQDSRVASSAVIAGGEVTIGGSVGGDATIRAGEIRIDGEILGNADFSGHEIRLGPKAVIGGNLRHRTENLIIEPGATIKGEITDLPYDQHGLEKKAIGILLVASAIGLLILAGMALSVLVIAGVFAGHMQATDRSIRGRIFSTLGIGLLATICFPVLFIVLLATVIGLPLAFLMLALWLAVQPLAFASAAHATGMAIRSGFGGGKVDSIPGVGGRMAYALLGLAILVVFGLVPIVGQLVWVVAGILGFGATIRELYRVLARPEAA